MWLVACRVVMGTFDPWRLMQLGSPNTLAVRQPKPPRTYLHAACKPRGAGYPPRGGRRGGVRYGGRRAAGGVACRAGTMSRSHLLMPLRDALLHAASKPLATRVRLTSVASSAQLQLLPGTAAWIPPTWFPSHTAQREAYPSPSPRLSAARGDEMRPARPCAVVSAALVLALASCAAAATPRCDYSSRELRDHRAGARRCWGEYLPSSSARLLTPHSPTLPCRRGGALSGRHLHQAVSGVGGTPCLLAAHTAAVPPLLPPP